MPLKFLQPGFESTVRSKLGVKESELPDSEINQRLIAEVAENYILKRVPDYQLITDEGEKILLESAIISYICYLLAPGMARRLNIEVSTMDVKWKKDKIDWSALAEVFLGETEFALMGIESVSVDNSADSKLVEISRNERVPLA
jgi:hypothetical protein